MELNLTASGAPAQVTTDLAAQFKSARTGHEGAWPALATLRDYVAAEIAKAGAQPGAEAVVVAVKLSVTVTGVAQGNSGRAQGTGASKDSE